jgi:hypothetical protein
MASTVVLRAGQCIKVRCGPGVGTTVGTVTLHHGEFFVVTCTNTNQTTIVKCGPGQAKKFRGQAMIGKNQSFQVCCAH